MIRVFIWGTGKLAKECMNDLLPDIEIVGYIESVPEKKIFCGLKVLSAQEFVDEDYDYVILANSHEADILKDFTLDDEKVVYYRLSIEWDDDQKVYFKRKNAEKLGNILFKSQRKLEITEAAREIMPYVSVRAEGLTFLFNCNDNLIANDILGSGNIYSAEEMLFFHEIAPKVENGYFLDVGANVGTTSIYFRKNICSSLKYIAFEPLKENYKMLKTNCILNDCEDILTINAGMSNVTGQRKMHVFEGAFGSSMVSENVDASEVCDFITLDDFVREQGLQVKNISYFWVDVQCHELEFVEGGLNTLKDSPASLFIEFNIADYRKTGKTEKFLNLLGEIYSTFICYEQYERGIKKVRNIRELVQLPLEMNLPFCNILLMK